MSNEIKAADLDNPVFPALAERWSPYGFSDKPVSVDDLKSLFEAARWTQSSYNEQPWRYIVARKEQSELFDKLLACLVEGNQSWAKFVPVLVLGVVSENFSRNGKVNIAAEHDLGAASAALTFEASIRGLFVHQMIGIEPDKAKDLFAIPDGFRAFTALAIGYAGKQAGLPDDIAARDQAARSRHAKSKFVFAEKFGVQADWLS